MNWLKTHIDFKFGTLSAILLAVGIMCALLAGYAIPTEWAASLGVLDWVQIAIQAGGIILVWSYSRDPSFPRAWQYFWSWSIWCWIITIGRKMNWTRLFFDPSLPRYYFKIVLAVLIFFTVIGFLRHHVYKRAFEIIRYVRFPFWIIIFGFLFWLGSEMVEHNRLGINLAPEYSEVFEESFEVAAFLALVFMTARLADGVRKYLALSKTTR